MSNSSLPSPTHLPPSPLGDARLVRKPLTGRDWVAVWFAAGILLIICIVVVYLLLLWRVASPSLGSLSVTDQKAAVENFKELSAVIAERMEKIFDLIVIKGLLPVFATIIGFLLGKHGKED